jgi:hypothetical protein
VPETPAIQNVVPEKTSFGRGGHHPRAEAMGVDRAVFNGGRESPEQAKCRLAGDPASGNPSSEPRDFTPRCSESIRRKRIEPVFFARPPGLSHSTPVHVQRNRLDHKPWRRLDRALHATDLLLSAGGFRVVVLDMGDVSPEYARRVPLATWYRFRLQAEKSQALLLLLTQAACANSCAAVSLYCGEPQAEWRQAAENSPSLLTGVRHSISISRNRAVDPYRKKPAASSPHDAKSACSPAAAQVFWTSTTLW